MKEKRQKNARNEFDPRIVAFVCKWCSGSDVTPDEEGTTGEAFKSSHVGLVSVMCSGRVHPSFVLKAFELGADGVIICGCESGRCHYATGNEKQAEMFETSKKLTALLGLEPQRLRLELLSPGRTDGLSEVMSEFSEDIRRVGPSPLRKSGGVA